MYKIGKRLGKMTASSWFLHVCFSSSMTGLKLNHSSYVNQLLQNGLWRRANAQMLCLFCLFFCCMPAIFWGETLFFLFQFTKKKYSNSTCQILSHFSGSLHNKIKHQKNCTNIIVENYSKEISSFVLRNKCLLWFGSQFCQKV